MDSKYILLLVDPNNSDEHELRIFLDEFISDTDAIAEANAQFEIMCSEGGFAYDEHWNNVKATLLKEGAEIWSDYICMAY